ncbi:MAG: leucine-rich repeat domain-containing protein [Salinivirgaceae bacterium]|nr:leucine-rich repeat domain-containing protein [Salinivirgaceae bacterium]
MKRIFTFLFALMAVGQVWAANNYDFSVGSLYYKIISSTEVAVVNPNLGGNYRPSGNIVVPETVVYPQTGGVTYSVTSINAGAFYNCDITSISLPDCITNVGMWAFGDWDKLQFNEEEDAKYLGNAENPHLCLMRVKSENITTFEINNNCKCISASAFDGCKGSLETITIPDNVAGISENAFEACANLRSITFGSGIKKIGDYAFFCCNKLTSITIPNSVTSIGDCAFEYCSNLRMINVESDNTKYTSQDGVLFSKDKKTIVCYPAGKVGDTYTIPNSVNSIGIGAFCGCSRLTSISIPKSVSIIGKEAFRDCRNLTSVTIPEDVSNIGWYAFDGCNNATIYYECELEPETWDANWNGNVGTVKRGCYVVSVDKKPGRGVIGEITGENYELIDDYGALWFLHDAIAPMVTVTYKLAKGYHWGEGAGEKRNTQLPIVINETVTESKTYWSDAEAVRCEEESQIFTDAAIPATCTESGRTAGKHCPICNAVLEGLEVIPALGHDWGAPTYVWAEDGSACTATAVCQHDENHVITENATITSEETIAPTCEEEGTTSYTAAFENELFATQTKDIVDVPATGHTYSNTVTTPTCTEIGYTTHTCMVCEFTYNSDTVAAKGHKADSVEFENIMPATCTAAGSKDSVVFCSVCQVEMSREERTIPALGHTEVVNEAIAPTCTKAGKTEGKYCSVCCAVIILPIVVPALGHTEVIDATVAATCTKPGLTEGKHCSVCNDTLLKQDTIAALGHTIVVDAAVEPTCTKPGLTEGKHCSVCNEVIVAQTEVAALGHNFGEYVYNNDATTDADGTETATCSRCGEKDTRSATGTKLEKTPEKGTAVAESAATAVNIYAHGNTIVIENATEEINVYNAMGTLVCRDAMPCVRAEINIYAHGVYIVKTGSVVKRVMINE